MEIKRFWRLVQSTALLLVVASPAAASARGLIGFGHDMLGLAGAWAWLVPATLDGAALYLAVLSMQAVTAGESAAAPRFLLAVYALGSAAGNAVHALYAVHADGGAPAAVYFAAMSVSAVVIWEVTLRHLRRQTLRELGALPAELPRFRALRWLLAPFETSRVWRHAVLHEITTPGAAIEQWRATRLDSQAPAAVAGAQAPRAVESAGSESAQVGGTANENAEVHLRSATAAAGVVPGQSSDEIGGHGESGHAPREAGNGFGGHVSVEHQPRLVTGDPSAVSKVEALVMAFTALGREDVPAAREWLAVRGVEIEKSYAYRLVRDGKAKFGIETGRGLRLVKE